MTDLHKKKSNGDFPPADPRAPGIPRVLLKRQILDPHLTLLAVLLLPLRQPVEHLGQVSLKVNGRPALPEKVMLNMVYMI